MSQAGRTRIRPVAPWIYLFVIFCLFVSGCGSGKPAALPYAGPIVDTHEHLQGPDKLDAMFSAMQDNNIQSIWLVGRGEPKYRDTESAELATLDGNNALILRLASEYPDKIKAFPRMRPERESDPAAVADALINTGASGIKIHFGSDPSQPGELGAADEPYLSFYKYCESKDILLMIHLEEQAQPGRIEAIAAACPKLRLIICHLGHAPERPELWGELLGEHPNLYTEFSFGFERTYALRAPSLSSQAAAWRDCVLAHPGQFLFGTDMVIGPRSNRTTAWISGRFRAYRELLELSKFHDRLVGTKQTWELDLTGLSLPPEMLKQIYWDNPRRLIGNNR